MILVCSGDSFTAGAELWEERNDPNYLNVHDADEAFEYIKKMYLVNPVPDDERKNLTYTNVFKTELNCKVINLGISGSSEIDTVQRTIIELNKLRQDNNNEKIVCILQHTDPNRVWIWKNSLQKNMSYSIPYIEKILDDISDGYEIKQLFMKNASDQQMYSDYALQVLCLQNYCKRNDILFAHFGMHENDIPPYGDSATILYMNSSVLRKNFLENCLEERMISRLCKFYQHSKFLLPGYHVNCESQILMGNWLIEEMKQRQII